MEHRAGQLGDPHIDACKDRFVSFELVFACIAADIVIHAGAREYAIVISQNSAALSRGYVLILIETERSDVADSAAPTAFVGHSDRLASVFDDLELVLPGNCNNCIHIAN